MPESQMLTLRLPAAILNTDEILKTVPTEQLIAEISKRPGVERWQSVDEETAHIHISCLGDEFSRDVKQIIFINNTR